MKEQDIEKLKEICEREGFKLKRKPSPGIEFEISKKDPWDKVEFAELHGKNKKIKDQNRLTIWFTDGSCIDKVWANPATEQEYIEQLIKEAKERFGEIKEGDRFVDPGGGEWGMDEITEDFRYEKDNDFLYFNDYIIYEAGEWAEKVKRCEVVHGHSNDFTGLEFSPLFTVNKQAKKKMQEIGIPELRKFLAKQLENYLNEV